MTENLISEGIGVVVELLLVYFLINSILDRRENKRWNETRRMVAIQAYNTVFMSLHAVKHSFRVESHHADHEADANARYLFISKFIERLEKLKVQVDLTGTALNSKVLPPLVNIIESSDALVEHFKYLLLYYTPQVKAQKKQFLVEPPINHFNTAVEAILELAEIEGLFDENKTEISKKLDQDVFSRTYNKLIESCNDMHLPSGNYSISGTDSKIFCFSPLEMSKINGVIPDGKPLQMFRGV